MARLYNFQSIAGANTQLQNTGTEMSNAIGYRQFAVDFSLFGGTTLYCAYSGVWHGPATNLTVRVRVGGTVNTNDGTVAASYNGDAPGADTILSCSGTMAMPSGVQLVTLSFQGAVSAVLNFWIIYLEGRSA